MRRLVLSIALAVSVSALYAGPAVAQRHDPAGNGAPAPEAPILRVTLSFPRLKKALIGGVGLARMTPNTTYEIAVFESPELNMPFTSIVAGTVTTDNVGNGKLAIKVKRIPGSTTFFVAAVSPRLGQTYGSSDVELD
jgi:hypothetical protein